MLVRPLLTAATAVEWDRFWPVESNGDLEERHVQADHYGLVRSISLSTLLLNVSAMASLK